MPPSVASDEAWPVKSTLERKLVRKLDSRLMPTVFLIFVLNFIDRNAVTTARLQGLAEDLNLTDLQYSIILSVLFVTYSVSQVPSNMILSYVTRPSIYIGSCVVLWGIISTLTGITQNYHGLLACRLMLGIPEAAFYPGTIFLLSRWYTKKELAFRSCILYSGLLISNAFGVLMAAGILDGMEGKAGVRAWRWLFFIEGSITIVFGFCSMWLLPDTPSNTRWISAEERHLAQSRLAEDAGEADCDDEHHSVLDGLKLAVRDYRVWMFSVMMCAQALGISNVIFFPTLTQTLGYSTNNTLLLAAPPWIVASLLGLLNSWNADRTGERYFHTAGWAWASMLGFVIAFCTMSVPARYASLFLMAAGNIALPMISVWVSNVVARPPAKRAVSIAITNGIGHWGTLAGSYLWESKWGPEYRVPLGVCFAALAVSSALGFVIRCDLRRANKRLDFEEKTQLGDADRKRVEEAARLEGITLNEAMEKRKGHRFLY